MSGLSRYDLRGVSASKQEVHAAIQGLSKGLYPGAFCTILPDLAGNREYCSVIHADGAGTKAALAYLAWKHGANIKVWRGITQDSLVMNIDDVGCVGAGRTPIMFVQAINRNPFVITGEVLRELVTGGADFTRRMGRFGLDAIYAGGETADVPDLTRTLTVDNTVFASFPDKYVIDASRIRAGDVIIGFSSTGRAMWEDEFNSGIGSNGLTNARHDVLSSDYRKDIETYNPHMDTSLVYRGEYHLDDELPGDKRFSIGSALLSPTRTYLPLMVALNRRLQYELHALIHCSGGGQTKIGKFGGPGLVYHKTNLFPVPPLFSVLQSASDLPWDQMYRSYNMGHRLEALVPEEVVNDCLTIADSFNIDARVVGKVLEGSSPNNTVVIESSDTQHRYDFKAA
jgi:phosphoribosylformylglycinamidine cyclo-ligase